MAEIEDVLQDEKFVRKILECKTKDEGKTAFKEKNIDRSDEECEDLKKFYSEVAREVKKMTPEELKQVSEAATKVKEMTPEELTQISGGDADAKMVLAGGALGAASGAALVGIPMYATWRSVKKKYKNPRKIPKAVTAGVITAYALTGFVIGAGGVLICSE